jgi:hypothetical protein
MQQPVNPFQPTPFPGPQQFIGPFQHNAHVQHRPHIHHVHHAPSHAPVHHAPVHHAPVHHAPSHAPVHHAPRPVHPAPVHHAPRPVHHAPTPVHHAPRPVRTPKPPKNNNRINQLKALQLADIFGQDTTTVFLMADVANPLHSHFEQRNTAILGKLNTRKTYHLTLIEMKVNHSVLPPTVFNNIQNITNTFHCKNVMNNVVLTEDKYTILGSNKKFWTMEYDDNAPNAITSFKASFYDNFLRSLGKTKRDFTKSVVRHSNGIQYHVFSYNGIPWYAIANCYFGTNSWRPHVSIFNLDELSQNNAALFQSYQRHGVKVIENSLPRNVGSIGSISFSRDIGSLSFSVKNVARNIERKETI